MLTQIFKINITNKGLSIKTFASSYSRMNLKRKYEYKKKLKENEGKETENKDTEDNQNIQKVYSSPIECVPVLKNNPVRGVNDTINMTVSLNIDIRKGDQNVRGVFKMPGGSNKIPKIIVFTSPDYREIAKAAGADTLGDETTVNDILQNKPFEFDKCIATMEMIPLLKKVGRILGPKGLMPSVKVGTACTPDNLVKCIKDFKIGTREFKADVNGQIIVPIGKFEFDDNKIYMNIDSFMRSLLERKPTGVKGRYFLYAYISTRRLSCKIDMKSLDPLSSYYFMNKLENKNI
jgi:large subunit ribosomal protein L1